MVRERRKKTDSFNGKKVYCYDLKDMGMSWRGKMGIHEAFKGFWVVQGVIIGMTLMILGAQTVFSAFMLSILG